MAAEQANGQSYFAMTESYYKSSMYDDDITIMENLFDETASTFNPIPKVINMATGLSVGGKIKYVNDENDFVKNFLDFNDFDNLKTVLAKTLIQGKKLLIELIESKDDEGETNFKIILHDADSYEIVSDGTTIYQAEITTSAYIFNESDSKYEAAEITKTYTKTNDGVNLKITGLENQDTGDDETLEEEQEFSFNKLPVIEITTGYDLKQLMYSTDRYNEIDSFIRNIFYLAGEPVLVGLGMKKLKEADIDNMGADRYKKQKTLFGPSPEKADLKLLEIQGTSATTMIEKQRQIIETIVNDYPEYAMSEVISGSNVSSDTTKIRLSEILSRINELQTSIQKGMDQMIKIVSTNQGTVTEGRAELSEILGRDLSTVADLVEKLMELGLISRESSMTHFTELYINENTDDEIAKIDSESKDETTAETNASSTEEISENTQNGTANNDTGTTDKI